MAFQFSCNIVCLLERRVHEAFAGVETADVAVSTITQEQRL